jgi:hypothetical protein
VLIALALSGGVAAADVPDPSQCSVFPPDLQACPRTTGFPNEPAPHPSANLDITVRNFAAQPIQGAYVEVVIHPVCTGICICSTANHTGYTNAEGEVVINLGYGGCCHIVGAPAVVIYADGIPIRAFDYAVSPDWNGVTGDCQMALDDFILFGNVWVSGAGGCTDFDGSCVTDIADFTMFGQAWSQGCTPAP